MTKECMKVTLISHWFVGLPIGCFLGFHSKWGCRLMGRAFDFSFLVGGLLFYLFLRKKRELSHTPHI